MIRMIPKVGAAVMVVLVAASVGVFAFAGPAQADNNRGPGYSVSMWADKLTTASSGRVDVRFKVNKPSWADGITFKVWYFDKSRGWRTISVNRKGKSGTIELTVRDTSQRIVIMEGSVVVNWLPDPYFGGMNLTPFYRL